jgi:DNA-methyltransferase (dcm)
MVCKTHLPEFEKFKEALKDIGYNVSFKVLNANDYEVPQDRRRVFLVGLHESLNKEFEFPEPIEPKLTLRDAIGDLPEPVPAYGKNKANPFDEMDIPNHEYMTGNFSTMYMSRNRVRKWDEPSFTIQAGGRHAPCHPQANTMIKVDTDKRIFDPESPKPYRRLSVRECARIQTFPDDFIFYYTNVNDGYKMIGNAVPVKLARKHC